MEVCVVGAENNPDGCILSLSAGGSRRTAPLARGQKLNFGQAAAQAAAAPGGSGIKVDVLKVTGTTRIHSEDIGIKFGIDPDGQKAWKSANTLSCRVHPTHQGRNRSEAEMLARPINLAFRVTSTLDKGSSSGGDSYSPGSGSAIGSARNSNADGSSIEEPINMMMPANDRISLLALPPASVAAQKLAHSRASSLPTLVRQTQSPGSVGSAPNFKLAGPKLSRKHHTALEARSYLEEHSVLPMFEQLIRTLVKERPSEPWKYVASMLPGGANELNLEKTAKKEKYEGSEEPKGRTERSEPEPEMPEQPAEQVDDTSSRPETPAMGTPSRTQKPFEQTAFEKTAFNAFEKTGTTMAEPLDSQPQGLDHSETFETIDTVHLPADHPAAPAAGEPDSPVTGKAVDDDFSGEKKQAGAGAGVMADTMSTMAATTMRGGMGDTMATTAGTWFSDYSHERKDGEPPRTPGLLESVLEPTKEEEAGSEARSEGDKEKTQFLEQTQVIKADEETEVEELSRPRDKDELLVEDADDVVVAPAGAVVFCSAPPDATLAAPEDDIQVVDAVEDVELADAVPQSKVETDLDVADVTSEVMQVGQQADEHLGSTPASEDTKDEVMQLALGTAEGDVPAALVTQEAVETLGEATAEGQVPEAMLDQKADEDMGPNEEAEDMGPNEEAEDMGPNEEAEDMGPNEEAEAEAEAAPELATEAEVAFEQPASAAPESEEAAAEPRQRPVEDACGPDVLVPPTRETTVVTTAASSSSLQKGDDMMCKDPELEDFMGDAAIEKTREDREVATDMLGGCIPKLVLRDDRDEQATAASVSTSPMCSGSRSGITQRSHTMEEWSTSMDGFPYSTPDSPVGGRASGRVNLMSERGKALLDPSNPDIVEATILKFAFLNLSFDKLARKQELLQDLKSTLQGGIADVLQEPVACVEVELGPGSILCTSVIYSPAGANADAVKRKLDATGDNFLRQMEDLGIQVRGIKELIPDESRGLDATELETQVRRWRRVRQAKSGARQGGAESPISERETAAMLGHAIPELLLVEEEPYNDDRKNSPSGSGTSPMYSDADDSSCGDTPVGARADILAREDAESMTSPSGATPDLELASIGSSEEDRPSSGRGLGGLGAKKTSSSRPGSRRSRPGSAFRNTGQLATLLEEQPDGQIEMSGGEDDFRARPTLDMDQVDMMGETDGNGSTFSQVTSCMHSSSSSIMDVMDIDPLHMDLAGTPSGGEPASPSVASGEKPDTGAPPLPDEMESAAGYDETENQDGAAGAKELPPAMGEDASEPQKQQLPDDVPDAPEPQKQQLPDDAPDAPEPQKQQLPDDAQTTAVELDFAEAAGVPAEVAVEADKMDKASDVSVGEKAASTADSDDGSRSAATSKMPTEASSLVEHMFGERVAGGTRVLEIMAGIGNQSDASDTGSVAASLRSSRLNGMPPIRVTRPDGSAVPSDDMGSQPTSVMPTERSFTESGVDDAMSARTEKEDEEPTAMDHFEDTLEYLHTGSAALSSRGDFRRSGPTTPMTGRDKLMLTGNFEVDEGDEEEEIAKALSNEMCEEMKEAARPKTVAELRLRARDGLLQSIHNGDLMSSLADAADGGPKRAPARVPPIMDNLEAAKMGIFAEAGISSEEKAHELKFGELEDERTKLDKFEKSCKMALNENKQLRKENDHLRTHLQKLLALAATPSTTPGNSEPNSPRSVSVS